MTALAFREFVRPGEERWERYLARLADVAGRAGRTEVLVAVADGRIVGCVTLELEGRTDEDDPPLAPEEAHVRMLGVHPGTRRRGVARALMAACEARARLAGKTLLSLHTTRQMRAAQHMYRSLGFERGPDRVFPDGFVLLSFFKRLDPRDPPSPGRVPYPSPAGPLPVRTTSPEASTTPSSHSASTRPPRNCCS